MFCHARLNCMHQGSYVPAEVLEFARKLQTLQVALATS